MEKAKYKYLPASVNENGPCSPAPPPIEGRYPCPCCGELTFPVPKEEAIAFICPVCWWENDVFTPGEDQPSDENRGLTLREARKKFKRYGAVRPDLTRYSTKRYSQNRGEE